jgi:formate hydrogenlyase subunit 3/multisubunit Na+/H+ antiporter MnhD subunit
MAKQKLLVSKSAARSTVLVFLSLLFFLVAIASSANWFGLADWIASSETLRRLEEADWLLLVLLVLPILGGLVQMTMGSKHVKWRDRIVIGTTFIDLGLSLLISPNALNGGIQIDFPRLLGLGLHFHLDMLGYAMILITNVVWLFVMIFTHVYIGREKRSTRFYFFLAITYATVLGAVAAADLFTMYLYFEIMTVASYLLVVHDQKDDSIKAAGTYLFMGLFGGFLILAAMLLLYFEVGDLRFLSALNALNEVGSIKYWILGLLIAGFGVKAGVVPLHIWLPRAHPVAPTPASALLSGILIKVGAYGILRVATSYYFPLEGSADATWLTVETVGFFVIWLGILTMSVGVFMALQQSHVKKMLAYHSVSQMGYIVMGVGIAMYLGDHGAIGYAGAVYHILNHALFKSLLFLVAGVVSHHTHEMDMYKLGGLWKKLPVTTILSIVASLGIAGIPLFNGFVSKSILHHGIVEAVHEGSWVFQIAEIVFLVVSAGTVASFVKMNYHLFFKKTERKYDSIGFEWDGMNAAMIGLSFFIVAIGLFPGFLIETVILPQIRLMGFDAHFVEEAFAHLDYFNPTDILTMAGVAVAGYLIFHFGTKYHWFHLHLPRWMSFDYLIVFPLYQLLYRSCKVLDRKNQAKWEEDERLLSIAGTNDTDTFSRIRRAVVRLSDATEGPIMQGDALIYAGAIALSLIILFLTGM